MTTAQKHDDDLETTLQRAAGYLARRGSEYLEHPIPVQESDVATPHRYKRVLVGTAAAATLCVTALAGSFIGGTSSGKVDVAQAAWSAEPRPASGVDVADIARDCKPIISEMWKASHRDEASLSDEATTPSAVEARGTTKLAVYFWSDTSVTVCFRFDDGSTGAQSVGSNAVLSSINGGSIQPLSVTVGGKVIGLVWGDLPRDFPEGGSIALKQERRSQTIVPTIIPNVHRYVAWTPSIESIQARFIDDVKGDTLQLGPVDFPTPCLGDCLGVAETTSIGIAENMPPTTIGCFDPTLCEPGIKD